MTGVTAALLGAVIWLFINMKGLDFARKKRIESHELWMSLSFMFSFSTVWIRPVFMGMKAMSHKSTKECLASIVYLIPLVAIIFNLICRWFETKRNEYIEAISSSPLLQQNNSDNNQNTDSNESVIRVNEDFKRLHVFKTNGFIECTLHEIEQLDGSMYLVRLKLPHDISKLIIPPGRHCALRAMIPGSTFYTSRNYTPICTAGREAEGFIDFGIKSLPGGTLSSWLTDKSSIGSPVLLFGPEGSFKLTSIRHQNLFLIAGGSGITPMLTLIHEAMQAHIRKSEVIDSIQLLYFSKDGFAFREELEKLSSLDPGFFTINFIAGRRFSTSDIQSAADCSRDGSLSESLLMSSNSTTTAIVCGPPQMLLHCSRVLQSAGIKKSRIALLGWDDQ